MLFFHLISFYIINKILKNNYIQKPIAKIIHYVLISVTLFWSVALVVRGQLVHGQISAYIIFLFSFSTIIYLTKLERVIFIGGSYFFFITGILLTPINEYILYGHIVSSIFTVVIANYVSALIHKQYYDNYVKSKKIEGNIEIINRINSDLEKVIRNRTKALLKKNKLLVEEIHKRLEEENDYTNKKIEFEKAIEHEKIRTMFLANLSHELRTPLNIIFSAQQMIDRLLDEDLNNIQKDKLAKFSRMIKQNSYRLIRLIGNLIDITKIDAGHYKIKKRNIDIVELLEDIYISFAEYISNKNIKVSFNSELTSKVIACDPEQIERVVLNLLANSIKFLPNEGVVSIDLYEKDNKVIFSVVDNGIGISEDLHEAIFERFIQVDKTIRRNHEGSGIGLSLVKNFVEMHGGQIYVKSKLGSGSIFTVELPLIQLEEDDEDYTEVSNSSRVEKINIEFSDIYMKKPGAV